ncbi:hypothetical protein VKT23_000564 [Stygiomarasmius scandens]|uniref:Extracellular serine-rich protein n=1 Tax=Marasmiellus scandens TaxID=2682957 RepID=A0ABR1K4P3_9AGAR
MLVAGLISFLAFSGAVAAQRSSTATAAAPGATQTIWITVGLNTTNNASAVFQPASVKANLGDLVMFNFTQGNHSATQSTFDVPCTPAHDTNITINGFNSGIRIQSNETGSSILAVPMLPENVNMTMWFYDINTCSEGGVGVINANESSTETYDGFVRNAIRLFGTSTSSASSSHTSTGTSSSSPTSDSSDARRNIVPATFGGVMAMTLALLV